MRKLVSSLVVMFALWTAPFSGRAAARGGAPAPLLRLAQPVAQWIAQEPRLPRMAPELALRTFQERWEQQQQDLAGYSALTDIEAELPDTAQKGDYELEREYVAPHELHFKPLRFTGDNFVKTNVITRLLQSEVDHVGKDEVGATAITAANYKFSYKGEDVIDGRPVHIFQVKPRRKVAGLFKGRIYVDAVSGTLRRAEGTLVKSPSFFIKRIEFVQDYCDVGRFTLPLRTRSTAVTRVMGRAIVNILHRNYQARAISGAISTSRTDVPAVN